MKTKVVAALTLAFVSASAAFVNCSGGIRSSTTDDNFRLTDEHVLIGDMIFTRDQLAAASTSDVRATGFTGFRRANSDPWRNGIVPVRFKFAVTEQQRQLFFEACLEWTKEANIRCIPYGGQEDRIDVENDANDGCNSEIGRGPGRFGSATNMNLGRGCWVKGVIMHELGHAFGFLHEHQRPDRDRYIKINLQNVRDDKKDAFERIWNGSVLGAYDPRSVMHYFPNAFSKADDALTIEPQDGSGILSGSLGAGNLFGFLTEGDAEMARAVYGPPTYPYYRVNITLDTFDSNACFYVFVANREPQTCIRTVDVEVAMGDKIVVSYGGLGGDVTWSGGCAPLEQTPYVYEKVLDSDVTCRLTVRANGGAPTPPPTPQPTPPPPAPAENRLIPDQVLTPGKQLRSQNGNYTMPYQGDGNVVIYQNGNPIWATNTDGSSPGTLVMQADGNLVLYDGNGAPIWASNTDGNPGASLVLENNGTAVIYSTGGSML
ncbi:MAG TPA: M12 family metallopeptidase, partial [Bdellovibrionales bacterium]|nr:M12 family metallopeptidase [Bdellovibrionales bacterium]